MIKILYKELPENLWKKIGYCVIKNRNILLNLDIRNYYETLEIFLEEYYNLFKYTDPHDWILNDIYWYANEEVFYKNGYVPFFFNIVRRHWYFSNKSDQFIIQYIEDIIGNYDVQKQIRFFWGLFTPIERHDCLLKSLSKYFY